MIMISFSGIICNPGTWCTSWLQEKSVNYQAWNQTKM